MRDLKYREAMIWASGEILTEHFPENWETLEDDVLYKYIEDHAVDGEEYYDAEYQWSRISYLCDSVNRLIRELKDG